MNTSERIKKLKEFLDASYHSKILEKLRKGEKYLIVDFSELMHFDPNIAEALLDNPEDVIKEIELAVQEFDNVETTFKIRIENIPDTQKILVRNIRSVHLGKLLSIDGVVRQKSDVRPQVTSAKFECPSCGNIINVLQLDSSFKEPSRCGCGRRGKFRMVSKELVDAQGIVLEEAPEQLEGGAQPKRINILLKDDLVSPMSERKTNPGSKINVVGQVKEVPIILRTGMKSTRFDLIIEANYVNSVEETFYELEISKEDETKILEIANDKNVRNRLVEAIAPSIFGYDKVKEALLMQMLGGVQKTRKDGVVTRGDIHILLVGDPGAGKSALLKRMNLIAPKGRYVTGKGISAAGLTASVVRDEFLKGWSLEAGAMVLASDGICMIDELDKMTAEDRSAMHEAMENQTVSISKANIQATLIARTTVLAAANPKFGRFDPYDVLAKQINLPPTLINRFDLIFPIKDLPEETRDEKMAGHILLLHQNPEISEPEIPTQFLKKYLAYAKQKVKPQLTDSALEEIKTFYVEMRNRKGVEEGASRAIPISPRQLEALVRLAEASARMRLSHKVTKYDARRAIDLLHYCLSQVGIDPETGKIDIDRIATGVSASARNKIITIKEIIEDL
ncbi:minichromosome maintenance protein MCM, partial [Candidatus Woesearchaeota archaeon]|nr:minichromosome maintenance protein MCM [Candidatus Woesearchaeota archaeon]